MAATSKRAEFLEHRVPPPLVALICAGIMQYLAWQSAGLPVYGIVQIALVVGFCAAGALVALAGMVSFRRARTTINPHKPGTASALVTSGIYQYTRNPMYLGILLVLVAWGFYLSSLIAFVGVCAFWLYIERFQIRPEERVLEAMFRRDFIQYRERVRRWL